jgi:hypothetical protein
MQQLIDELNKLNQLQAQKIKELEEVVKKQANSIKSVFDEKEPFGFNTIDKRGLYYNTHMDRKLFNALLSRIDQCISVASKYNGRVFGGYVRNVLVPRQFNIPCPGFKDLDLWFTTKEQADFFVREMGLLFRKIQHIGASPSHVVKYPFERDQYYLVKNTNNLEESVIVDVVVSKEIPVDDLNVNQLTFNTYEGFISFGNESTDALMTFIKNKEAVTLPGWMNKVKNDFIVQGKRYDKLKQTGWMIHNNVSLVTGTKNN